MRWGRWQFERSLISAGLGNMFYNGKFISYTSGAVSIFETSFASGFIKEKSIWTIVLLDIFLDCTVELTSEPESFSSSWTS